MIKVAMNIGGGGGNGPYNRYNVEICRDLPMHGREVYV
jgi:hypothetical protein